MSDEPEAEGGRRPPVDPDGEQHRDRSPPPPGAARPAGLERPFAPDEGVEVVPDEDGAPKPASPGR